MFLPKSDLPVYQETVSGLMTALENTKRLFPEVGRYPLD